MEEPIMTLILGQQLSLNIKQFNQISPIITQTTLQNIRLPLRLSQFKVHLPVLHVCLYYLIAVDKQIINKCSINFSENCLAAVTNYYLGKGMNFELYQYSYLLSQILGISLQKCMHMIYYMLYGRLAARPFILGLIQQAQRGKRGQGRKTRGSKDSVVNTNYTSSNSRGGHNSRHMTIFCDSPQYELDCFQKQLKETLYPSHSHKKMNKSHNKRYFNLHKVYPQATSQSSTPNEDLPLKSASVPIKVKANQLSSVLRHFVGGWGTDLSLKKESLVRRQKFNQFFNGFQKYSQVVEQMNSKESRKIEVSQSVLEKDKNKKNQAKQDSDFFKDITQGLKNTNIQLDSIRAQFSQNTNQFKKKSQQPQKQNQPSRFLFAHRAVMTQVESVKPKHQGWWRQDSPFSRQVMFTVNQAQPKEGGCHMTRKSLEKQIPETFVAFKPKNNKIHKTQTYKMQKRAMEKQTWIGKIQN